MTLLLLPALTACGSDPTRAPIAVVADPQLTRPPCRPPPACMADMGALPTVSAGRRYIEQDGDDIAWMREQRRRARCVIAHVLAHCQ